MLFRSYGTSLTAGGAWVQQLSEALAAQFSDRAKVINSGKGGMWSKWGVDNLQERVIDKKPDAVLIEFAINDAYLEYKTEVADARANLIQMIDRIQQAKPTTEVVLMTMNPPIGIHLERRPKIQDYYQMYRDVARDRKLLLVDHSPRWERLLADDKATFDRYMPDGLHPESEGCAQVITPAILKAIGLPAESLQPAPAGAE